MVKTASPPQASPGLPDTQRDVDQLLLFADPTDIGPVVARDYSRAYLHHLVKANEILAAMLISAVNLAYYQELMDGMRAAIAAGRFADFREEARARWARGDFAALT